MYKDVNLTLNKKGIGTVTTSITGPEITLKDTTGLTKTNVKVRYSLDGVDQGEDTAAQYNSNKITKITQQALTTEVTEEEAKEAIASGTGYITKTYTVEYLIYNTDEAGYNAAKGKNTTSPIARVTEIVVVKINAYRLTLTSKDGKTEVWNVDKATEYAAQLAAEKKVF